MRGVFVTGTDTGVGKTVVTGLLGKYLREKGYRVATQKWIQTGCRIPVDINLHLKIMGMSRNEMKDYHASVCPYIFKLAASPHLAAQAEQRKIQVAKIKKSFSRLSSNFDFVIVEGIGGALVPLDQQHLVIDIARALDLPVLVVAQNKLGAINHTLMTVEVLKNRKMKILGIIFNNLKGQQQRVLKDNPGIIKKFTRQRILGVLPWNSNFNLLYKKFLPLARKIT